MAIENTYLLGKNITLGCGFDLQAKAPLDSRQTVPEYAGLQALIDGNAAYEGMIVYDEETKKTYQAQLVDGVLAFREFGINEAELKDLIASETTAAMEFKGVAAALPTSGAKGDMYKVSTAFTVEAANDAQAAGFDAKVGDSIVCDGDGKWFLIPSGDDIEDTWRPVTDVANDATLTFAAGDKLDVAVASNGTITYSHEAIDAPTATPVGEDEQTRTYITEVITDGHGHITGYKTATENVEDTNTEYTFEGQSDEATSVYFQVTSNEEGASAEVIYLDTYSKNEADAELAKKLDKATYEAYIAGKEMSDADLKKHAEDYADSLAENYAAAEHEHTVADITDFDAKVKEYGYATTGEVATAKSGAEAKAAELDAALKSELQAEISGKVDKVDGHSLVSDTEIERLANVDNYDDEEVRGLIGDNAEAIEALGEYVGTIPSNYTETNVISYINKKAEETLAAAQGGSSETAASVKQQLDNYKSENDTRVKAAEDAIDALEVESAKHALKTDVEAEFAKYNTTAAQKVIDDAQDSRIKAIEDTYLVEADIADFETKANVKKVADDLAAYVESNDAALAAETKARTDADADFETRIAALEDNFGDGEGTVEAQIEAAVKAEEDARKEAVQGVQDAVDAIEADYVKSADIANFETKENVKKVADDLAAYEEANDAALAEVKATAEAARTEDEVNSQIDTKIAALNLATTYEPIGAETRAKAYADGLISDANLAQYTTEQEVKDIVDGVIAGAVDGDTITGLANLVEYLNTHGGEAKEMGAAIDVLEGKVEVIEGKPAYGITATQISNWDNEVGAKALAETKLDAAVFEAYSNAHAGDYTNKQIDDAIDADVKAAIDAEVARANGAYDTKGAAAAAQTAAEATAAGALSSARTEITSEIGTAISGEVSRADGKYEEKGVAQAIVNALKLSETYEPIGAETRAIAAAKTETENQVKALAEGAVADNAADIADIMAMLTWGSF